MLADHGKALEPVQLVARAEDRARGDNGEDQLPALLAPEDGSYFESLLLNWNSCQPSAQKVLQRQIYLKIVS